MQKVRGVFHRVAVGGNVVGAVFLAFVLLLMVGEIGRRLIFKAPIPGSTEMVGVAMGVLATIGFAFALDRALHVRSDWLVDKFPPRGRHVMILVMYFTGVMVTGLLSWRLVIGAIKSLKELEIVSGILQVPVYPSKVVMAFAMILFCVNYLLKFIENLKHSQE